MKRLLAVLMALGLVILCASIAVIEKSEAADLTLTQLVEGFKETTVASVSDAIDQVTGQRGFMYHDMRLLFKAKVVGPAVTALIRPSIKATGPTGPNHSLMVIDEADPGSVLVIMVEEGLDISGIGGLMATACKARELAGAVIDGAARDVDELPS
jgi:regulator of RNase E activity RraA